MDANPTQHTDTTNPYTVNLKLVFLKVASSHTHCLTFTLKEMETECYEEKFQPYRKMDYNPILIYNTQHRTKHRFRFMSYADHHHIYAHNHECSQEIHTTILHKVSSSLYPLYNTHPHNTHISSTSPTYAPRCDTREDQLIITKLSLARVKEVGRKQQQYIVVLWKLTRVCVLLWLCM